MILSDEEIINIARGKYQKSFVVTDRDRDIAKAQHQKTLSGMMDKGFLITIFSVGFGTGVFAVLVLLELMGYF